MTDEEPAVPPELLPSSAEVERYARTICWAWSMDPDSEVLSGPLPAWPWSKQSTCPAWKSDDVQRFAWAMAACAKADADRRKP